MIQDLAHIFDLLVRRSMKHDNHRTQQADCTAQLSESTELFFEKIRSKHRPRYISKLKPRRSCISYPMRTLSAPRGVTRIAGAKAYAAKLEISPNTTITSQRMASKRLSTCLTCDNTGPPQWHFQIRKPFSLEAQLISCIIKTLYQHNKCKLCLARRLAKPRLRKTWELAVLYFAGDTPF
jgi:hypothetical protein